jgi:hypothetical protein
MNEYKSSIIDDAPDLAEAIGEHFTPQAVAAIASYLSMVDLDDPGVQVEVEWLRDLLIATIGGDEAFDRLAREIGR